MCRQRLVHNPPGYTKWQSQLLQWLQLMKGMDVVTINSKTMCANTNFNPAKFLYECQLALKRSGRIITTEHVGFQNVVFHAAAANRTKRTLTTTH
jgi:hypothetical protein